jgi:HlyD family secretion protein
VGTIGKTVVALGLVGTVAAFVVLAGARSNGTEPGITLVPVERGAIVEKAMAMGQIRPLQEIQVKSKISGIVRECFVQVGDVVKAGDRLFEILPNPTPLELTEAERSVEMAKASFTQAKAQFDRNERLLRDGVLAQRDHDLAKESHDQAKIQLDLAEQRLALLTEGRILESDGGGVESVIHAPAPGTVLERLVNPGDPVVPLTSYQAGTPLLSLADMDLLVFKGTVDEIDVGKLTLGLPVRIKVGALPDATVAGKLLRIAPKGKEDQGATLFDVEVSIEERGAATLLAGYSANGEIVIREKKDVLLVPERVVSFEAEKAFVEVPGATDDAEPVKKEIEAGLSDGLKVEVVSGLAQGDQVVQRPPKKIE